jgi:mannosyltransferase OCH1-like enzyme
MRKEIPKIIHQVWSGIEDPLPESFKELAETWKKHHPAWKYMFWDNKKMNEFIRAFCPAYWEPYYEVKYNIQRWDLIRYLILYQLGGMYVDMDYECLDSIELVLEDNKGCYFSAEPTEHARLFGLFNVTDYFNNALMISMPQHPFMKLIIESAFKELSEKKNYSNKMTEILMTTGPLLLTNLYSVYEDTSDICIISPELVSPLTKIDVQKYLTTECSAAFESYLESKLEKAVAIHYFLGKWL